VIARRRFARLIPKEAGAEFLDLIRRRSLLIPVRQSDVDNVEPPCRDATDNFILALAYVARANILVSSDHDLLVLNPWQGIPILTPAQFLAQSDKD
jgi:putative PIN family toxin of toxin-antitoxin system